MDAAEEVMFTKTMDTPPALVLIAVVAVLLLGLAVGLRKRQQNECQTVACEGSAGNHRARSALKRGPLAILRWLLRELKMDSGIGT